MDDQYILGMQGITKRFGGSLALDHVDFHLRSNSVHALMGENGAGKSTLMKVLLGLHQPDEGHIIYQGKEVSFKNPRDALNMGFAMIHQELLQMEEMSVADNMFMGRFPGTVVLKKQEIIRQTKEALDKLGITGIDPKAKIKSLSIAQKQLVEIAKAVSWNAKVIVMDEPTSALMDHEIEILFNIIHGLKANGCSIVYISHKMDEIFRISDEITVLRDGEFVGNDFASNLDNGKLVKMMVGRELNNLYEKSEPHVGEKVLEVEDLSSDGKFQNVSFSVHKGEVVGFSGLLGAGRSELMETIFGLRKKTGGRILKDGKELEITCPKDAVKNGIAFVTEDRKKTGLFLEMPIGYNISIAALDKLTGKNTVPRKKESEDVAEMSKRFGVKTKNLKNNVSSLSGGNQQKVVLAKWMMTNPDLLILDEPTRGIDVGAKKEIYTMIDELAASGKAVIVISSEMPEVLGVSDRILVMHEGKLKGELTRKEASQVKIMSLLTD